MSTTTIGPYTQGEIPADLVVTFKDAAGNPLDFSTDGPWTAKWEYRSYGGETVSADASVSVAGSGSTEGQVTYVWQDGDLTAGDFEAEMWVGNGNDQRLASVKFIYTVRPALAVPLI